MKIAKFIMAGIVGSALSIILLPVILTTSASAQSKDLRIALQRGFRTGYSDGYMAGYRDRIDSLGKDYVRHSEYGKGERAYNADYGTIEDYRDGYRQGFESGYDTGFDKKGFETTLPANLKKRGNSSGSPVVSGTIPDKNVASVAVDPQRPVTEEVAKSGPSPEKVPQMDSNAIIIIPPDTELMIELQEDISTDKSRSGEKFTAKVVSPSELDGAIVEGRIAKVIQPGRIKRRSEIALTFDRIVINDARWSNFSASLVEAMPVKGDNIKFVDAEGTAIGQSSLKGDAIKVGAAAGTGLVVGAVVGGPVGAAVGAGVGAAFGVGAVVIDRGKHIRLVRNQQLRIKTDRESRIR